MAKMLSGGSESCPSSTSQHFVGLIGFGPVDFSMRRRTRHGSADRWRELRKQIIELDDGSPIRAPGVSAFGVHRLNRRFDLESPQARMSGRRRKLLLGLVDQWREPFAGILFRQWNGPSR